MEADLQHFYTVDLADFWLGGLSLRRLSVLVAGLPADSVTARKHSDIEPGWDVHAFLLADLFKAFTGQEHPARPQPKRASRYAEMRARLEMQKARLKAPTPK